MRLKKDITNPIKMPMSFTETAYHSHSTPPPLKLLLLLLLLLLGDVSLVSGSSEREVLMKFKAAVTAVA